MPDGQLFLFEDPLSTGLRKRESMTGSEVPRLAVGFTCGMYPLLELKEYVEVSAFQSEWFAREPLLFGNIGMGGVGKGAVFLFRMIKERVYLSWCKERGREPETIPPIILHHGSRVQKSANKGAPALIGKTGNGNGLSTVH